MRIAAEEYFVITRQFGTVSHMLGEDVEEKRVSLEWVPIVASRQ